MFIEDTFVYVFFFILAKIYIVPSISTVLPRTMPSDLLFVARVTTIEFVLIISTIVMTPEIYEAIIGRV